MMIAQRVLASSAFRAPSSSLKNNVEWHLVDVVDVLIEVNAFDDAMRTLIIISLMDWLIGVAWRLMVVGVSNGRE